MSSNRRIVLERRDVVQVDGEELKAGEVKFVEVYVSYNDGSMGGNSRGYWLHFAPIKEQQCDGYTLQSFDLFRGVKKFVAAATRFGQKALERAAEQARQDAERENYIRRVTEDWNDRIATQIVERQEYLARLAERQAA